MILDGDPRLIDAEAERHTMWSAAGLIDMLAERKKSARRPDAV
ncbi:hypothetical protein [Streptomyces sp. NPDC002845]